MPDTPKTSPWNTPERKPAAVQSAKSEKPSRAWIGWLVLIFAVIGIVIAGIFYLRRPQGPTVAFDFSKPGQVFVGDPFNLSISLSNYSDAILKDAKMSLQLPAGISFVGEPQDQRVMEFEIGDVGPGSIESSSSSFPELIVTDGSLVNRLAHFMATFSYDTGSGSPTLQASDATDVFVGGPAVTLNITAPQSVLNGEDFQAQANYVNNTGESIPRLKLMLAYPPFFQFASSTPAAQANSQNSSWDLGTASSGANGAVTVSGNVLGPQGSLFSVDGALTAVFGGQLYTISSQSVNVTISQAPLSLAIVANSPNYVSKIGDTLNYTLTYANNSAVAMQNLTVSAKLTSALYDFTSLDPHIPFNSITNTISWSPANTPELANLAPGQSGSLNFTIKLKDAFPIRLLSDKNYTLKVDGTVKSPTVPPGTSAANTISLTSFVTDVAGKVDFSSAAYWRDAASGILNNGPYPPKVNQATQYTIHWKIVNYATDVSNVTVSAYLQSGVAFTNVVKSNMTTSPTYDPNSGLVTWQIPAIPATKGVIGVPAEAIFQVSATPAVNQAGGSMPLLSDAKFSAMDDFVSSTISDDAPAVDTSLPGDATIAGTVNRNVTQ
ncbi:MAG TPA: hypothetical protein VNG29_03715 [Candidatus Paceibacterota bacterium]|nr:hypothetical protein [Candidatus Paceibacterota bacterium]